MMGDGENKEPKPTPRQTPLKPEADPELRQIRRKEEPKAGEKDVGDKTMKMVE